MSDYNTSADFDALVKRVGYDQANGILRQIVAGAGDFDPVAMAARNTRLAADKALLVQQINNLERGQQTLIAERDAARAEAARWMQRCEGGWTHPDDIVRRVNELEGALRHIADGNISPAIDFARHVLDGKSVDEAHRLSAEEAPDA
jgi:hypothetical protein